MNPFFKAVLVTLISAPAFATTQVNLEGMQKNIQQLKQEIANECSPEKKPQLFADTVAASCPRTAEELRTTFCAQKNNLVRFFEGILSQEGVTVVSSNFSGGTPPPPEALGAVLLFHMKNSITQVNATWAHKVDAIDKKTKNCFKRKDMKKALTVFSDSVRENLAQTNLSVNPPSEMYVKNP